MTTRSRLTFGDIETARSFAGRMLSRTAAGLPGTGADWILGLCDELERLRDALNEIRKLDHDDFDTAFRYEQAVRFHVTSALSPEVEVE